MANPEHLLILKQGVDAWNESAKDFIVQGVVADLSGADLSGTTLSGANLFKANLSGANLSGTLLDGAVISEANLHQANLRKANLCEVMAHWAFLPEADLTEA